MQTQLAVIGGGPAGYVAALTAARQGFDVTLIESKFLGGTCLNIGCIPTKTLVQSALLFDLTKRFKDFGIEIGKDPYLDWMQLQKRKQQIITTLRKGLEGLLKKANVKIFHGRASFISPKVIEVKTPHGEKQTIEAPKVIIATGGRPTSIPQCKVDEEHILTSTGLLDIKSLPKSVLIIGGGVIGIEFACLFSLFGTKVTVVEMLPQILSAIDKDAVELLVQQLTRNGVRILTKTSVSSIDKTSAGFLKVTIQNEKETEEVHVEKVLVATGRRPCLEDLGLEYTGIVVENNSIKVNEKMETTVAGIYAAGDVIGGYQLAHVAFAEGHVAALNATGQPKEINYRSVPLCVYTSPEIAQVGLTEEQARQNYQNILVGKFPFNANGKALIEGDVGGFVKIISEGKYGEILGATVVGPHATELIATIATAMASEVTIEQLADITQAHPTLSEALREAALVAIGSPLHI